MSQETAVREAAAKLADALADADAAGLRVIWPRTPDGLRAMVISATARAIAPAPELRQLAELPAGDPPADPVPEPPAPSRRSRRLAE